MIFFVLELGSQNWAAMKTFFGEVCACCAKGRFKEKHSHSLHDSCVGVNLGFRCNKECSHYDRAADDLCCLEWTFIRMVGLVIIQLCLCSVERDLLCLQAKVVCM